MEVAQRTNRHQEEPWPARTEASGTGHSTRLAWSARTLGGIDPVRRAIADRMEARLRARADHPAPDLRHPPAIEQDKAALTLALLQMAERALAERRLGRPALRALLKTLFADVLVRRGDATAKERFRARHG